MNLKETANKLDLEENELIELINLFLKTSSSELTELESALQKKDFQVAERMAHSIKGAAGSLGFTDIYEMARKMEVAAKENCSVDIHEGHRIIKEKLDLIVKGFQGGESYAKD